MNPRRWLTTYLVAVVAITFIHSSAVLALLLAGAVAASGPARWRRLRRAALAILAFNLTVSLGYALVTGWQGNFQAGYLVLVNLRVLLLVYLGFWFADRVDLLAALAGWPTASLLASLSIGQIKTFERVVRDFRLAFVSRNLVRPTLRARGHGAAAQAQALLDKSVAAAGEAALGLRSRGAFDD